MRTMRFSRSSTRGSTLVVAIMVTGIIGVTLGSYLYLVQSQNRSVMHSLSWNAALPMAEAGVEEAMTQITRNKILNLSADNWTLSSNGYTKQRILGDGRFEVAIAVNTNAGFSSTNVSIRSTGYVRRPKSDDEVARTVLVGAGIRPKYVGIVTRDAISLGGNFYSDSFDSGNTNASTGGAYDPVKKAANSFIGSNSKGSNIVTIGTATVKGVVATGPGGSVGAKGGSSVGDLAWSSAGIQPGHSRDDMNYQIPDPVLPSIVWSPVVTVNLGGTNYVLLGGGNFSVASLASGSRILVTKPSVLYVPGTVSLDELNIESGGSLEMYVGGATTTLNSGGLINQGGNALNFVYYGLPSNTSITFSGDVSIVGCIYAPEADVSATGSGVLFGALSSNTLKAGGGFNYHFDENLLKNGPSYGLYITSWDEL